MTPLKHRKETARMKRKIRYWRGIDDAMAGFRVAPFALNFLKKIDHDAEIFWRTK